MIIVKITLLLLVITLIYLWLTRTYIAGNKNEQIRFAFKKDYCPAYVVVGGILVLITIVGIIASVVWLLFFM